MKSTPLWKSPARIVPTTQQSVPRTAPRLSKNDELMEKMRRWVFMGSIGLIVAVVVIAVIIKIFKVFL